MDIYLYKNIFQILKTKPMKPSEFEIFQSVESYDKKTAKNLRNYNDAAEKHIVSKL